MRLRLHLSADWKIIDQPRQRIAMIPGDTPQRPAAMLAWGPLGPAAAGEDSILPGILGVELGERRLELDAEEAKQTIDGWSYVERRARVIEGNLVVEERIAALFRFAEMRGVVIGRGFDIARWATLLPVVRKAFGEALPDWRGDGEVVCIEHLYEPVVD